MEELGLNEVLLEEINQQLGDQGLVIRSGEVSIIDASVIKAKNNRPNKGKDGKNTQDKEAAYNVKNGSDGKRKTTYGFKAHINVEEDGYIKRYEFSAGNVHYSQVKKKKPLQTVPIKVKRALSYSKITVSPIEYWNELIEISLLQRSKKNQTV